MNVPREYAIIDTETTGMRPPYSRIIDIGIIRVRDGEIIDSFQTLVNPGTTVPSAITRITEITDTDLINAPTFDEIALRVEELLRGAVLVAHNAAFDYAFVKAEFARIGMKCNVPTLCTVRLSRMLYPHERGHSLDAIIGRFGITCSERHRAYPDAEAVVAFLNKLRVAHGAEKLEHVIDRLIGEQRLGSGTIKELPETAGVYFFHGPEHELLYIGKSKHLRSRVRSHLSAKESKEVRLQNETASISSIETSGELSALILESALIKQQSPLYNRALVKRRALVVARRIRGVDGYDSIALSHTSELHADPEILAVFRTQTQGKAKLRELARTFKLCEKKLGLEKGGGPCFAQQLGVCDGACIHALSSDEHNTRLAEAFKTRRIKTWPYKGVVMITEQKDEDSGTVFFIDNWSLRGAYRFEHGAYAPLVEGSSSFDYDTYKILARFMRKPEHKRAIRVLSEYEFRTQLAACTNSYEAVIA